MVEDVNGIFDPVTPDRKLLAYTIFAFAVNIIFWVKEWIGQVVKLKPDVASGGGCGVGSGDCP